jgi:hypothetical protein
VDGVLWSATGCPDIRVKPCAYGHSVATLLNPRGVATVSHKYSLTVARHTSVVVAVPSTVRHPDNYKIKNILFEMEFKNVNKLFALIMCYSLRKYLLTKHGVTTTLHFVNVNICIGGDSNGSKSSYGPVLHFHT